MRIVHKGATSQSVYLSILDSTSTTGGRKTGLAFNTASLTAYYVRNGGSATSITLATLAAANSAWSSGGFKEVDSTNSPGIYRLDIPDAALASGVDSVVVSLKGATGMVQVDLEIQLVAVDHQDSVRFGMTALPNAAAEAAGGLYTRGTGAGQIRQDANGRIDANAKAWLDGTIPAVNVTGVPKVDTVDWLGTAPNALISGRVDANAQAVLSGAIAADVWNAARSSYLTAGSFGLLGQTITRDGTAQAGAAGSITLDASASATDSLYKGSVVYIYTGTGVGQLRVISGYTGSTKVATVAPNWTTTPDNTSKFILWSMDDPAIVGSDSKSLLSTDAQTGVTIPTVTTLTNAPSDSAGITTLLARIASALTITSGKVDVNDKTGFSLTQAFPTNFSSLVIDGSGRIDVSKWVGSAVNALISGKVDANAQVVGDKTGYSLTQTFPTNFSSLSIDASGRIDLGKWIGSAPNAIISGKLDTITNIRSSTAQAGASGSITLDASASATTDFYKDDYVLILSGTGAGQARLITAYNGSTKVATVTPNWATNPDNTSVFSVIPSGLADVVAWLATAPNVLISGRVDSNAQVVGDKTAYTLSQSFPTNFASLVIDGSGRIDLSKVLGSTINALISGRIDSNAQVVGDKTGYSLTQTFPTNFSSLVVDVSGRVDVSKWAGSAVNALLSGRVDSNAQVVGDKTGYSLTQTFPTNFSSLSIDGSGRVDLGKWIGSAPNALISGKLDSITSIRSSTAQAGATGTITLDASASATNDLYKDNYICILSGTGAGQTRLVTAYNGSTKIATITPSWTTNPDNTSVFCVIPSGLADVVAWLASAPNVLISGRVDSNAQVVGDKTGYSLSQSFPTNFASLVIDSNGRVDLSKVLGSAINALISGRIDANSQVVGDKTGYSLTQTFPTNFASLVIDGSGRIDVSKWAGSAVNALISGRVDANSQIVGDKTGYSLTQTFPTNFSSLSIDASGRIDLGKWIGTAPNALISGKLDSLTNIRSATAQAGTSTSITLDASAVATTDFYKDSYVLILGGTGAGQTRLITAYNSGTKVATVSPAWVTNPDNTSVFSIIPSGLADVVMWLGAAPNVLISGRVDSNAQVIGDKTGYSLSQTFPTNFATLVIDSNGRIDLSKVLGSAINALISGRVDTNAQIVADKTGYALTAGEHTSIGTDVQTGLTAQGYTTTRAGFLDTLNGLVAAVWDKATSAITTSGSIGKQIKDNLDTTISSRSTYGGGDTSGVTTLLSRIASALNITSGKIDVNDKTGFALTAGEHTNISTDTQTGLTAQGYTTTRAGYLDTLSGLIAAVWDKLLTGITTTGSIGKLIKDNIDAAISSRSTYAGGDTSGTTTLLSRIASALTITSGKIDVNDKTGFGVSSINNGTISSNTFAANAIDSGVFAQTAADKVWVSTTRVLTSAPYKKNTSLANFGFVMTDSSAHAAKTGITGPSFTKQVSVDGGAFSTIAGGVSEVGNGVYKVSLTASEMNGKVIVLRFAAAGSDDTLVSLVTED